MKTLYAGQKSVKRDALGVNRDEALQPRAVRKTPPNSQCKIHYPKFPSPFTPNTSWDSFSMRIGHSHLSGKVIFEAVDLVIQFSVKRESAAFRRDDLTDDFAF